ncbi:exosome complex component RRP40-like [Paramacrobiotus metropolitanus]|uniref:exosome complex component RRP40-like n=1 Tax=Paramacrobiotus metropolitanus TaxID=2943436 RepID=UPI002445A224|nr:exosome complex component RRP40-like [Paramacrobiotus metropolitanus]
MEMDIDAENENTADSRKLCIPGDKVFQVESSSIKTLTLGPGIRKSGDNLFATRVGIVHYKLPSTFFLETQSESYSPAAGDDVVGVVIKRKGHELSEQYFVVDLGRNVERQNGFLPVLAFRGATKRYRPNLKKGDLVYCRIRRVTPNGPVRLTCTNSAGTGCWGPLRRTGGVYRAGLAFVRRCLTDGSAEHTMITDIGTKVQVEWAVGINGRIWYYSGYEKSQNLLYLLLRDAEAAAGRPEAIKALGEAVLQQIACLTDDVPLEDNTQYWVTKVA